VIGVFLQLRPEMWRSIVQIAGSLLLLVSSLYLVRAFVVETYSLQHFSDHSRTSIYAWLAGVVLHVIGGVGRNRDP
jgi:hypothetical protein